MRSLVTSTAKEAQIPTANGELRPRLTGAVEVMAAKGDQARDFRSH